MPRLRSLQIAGPAGRLEAVLTIPDGEAIAAGVVCHPHPLYGGTMQSKAVFRASRAMVEQGVATMRFNFRGAGASEGAHDEGKGEQEDLRAVLAELEKQKPGLPLVVGGHSFGAIMALRVGVDDARVRALFALGLPIDRMAETSFLARGRKPILFVQGEEDVFGSAEAIRRLASRLPDSPSVSIVASAGHLFEGKLDELERTIAAWVAERPWEHSSRPA